MEKLGYELIAVPNPQKGLKLLDGLNLELISEKDSSTHNNLRDCIYEESISGATVRIHYVLCEGKPRALLVSLHGDNKSRDSAYNYLANFVGRAFN